MARIKNDPKRHTARNTPCREGERAQTPSCHCEDAGRYVSPCALASRASSTFSGRCQAASTAGYLLHAARSRCMLRISWHMVVRCTLQHVVLRRRVGCISRRPWLSWGYHGLRDGIRDVCNPTRAELQIHDRQHSTRFSDWVGTRERKAAQRWWRRYLYGRLRDPRPDRLRPQEEKSIRRDHQVRVPEIVGIERRDQHERGRSSGASVATSEASAQIKVAAQRSAAVDAYGCHQRATTPNGTYGRSWAAS